jgi:hypothetical protein
MIDRSSEDVFPLGECPRHLPTRPGKRVWLSTVYRWATSGSRGVRLESLILGGIRYTSAEALARFAAAVTAARDGCAMTPVASGRRDTAANREPDRIGI